MASQQCRERMRLRCEPAQGRWAVVRALHLRMEWVGGWLRKRG